VGIGELCYVNTEYLLYMGLYGPMWVYIGLCGTLDQAKIIMFGVCSFRKINKYIGDVTRSNMSSTILTLWWRRSYSRTPVTAKCHTGNSRQINRYGSVNPKHD
jgi:hypothetical protein